MTVVDEFINHTEVLIIYRELVLNHIEDFEKVALIVALKI